MKVWLSVFVTAILVACSRAPEVEIQASENAAPAPIEVKVVIVSLFEIGKLEGDKAGEFQLWKERRGLTTKFEQPHAQYDLYMNEDTGVLGMVTGIGTARSTAAIMALGLDPRFDLSKAYWLVAGIAGIDPNDAPVGSVAWARYVVDGDLSHEIDAREIPEDWEFGYFARHTSKPFDPNKPEPKGGEMFPMNGGLANWAYDLTKDLTFPFTEQAKAANAHYVGYPATQQTPFVLQGENLAALTFWHGAILNDWANKWVDYWTEGKGEFVTSAMEDTGIMQALTYLHESGKADKNRAMVMRAGSNYTVPPLGGSAAENLLKENEGYSGLQDSLEALYTTGSVVVDELLSDWPRYQAQIPTKTSP